MYTCKQRSTPLFTCIHVNNFCFADIEKYKEEKKREKHCLYGRNKKYKRFYHRTEGKRGKKCVDCG